MASPIPNAYTQYFDNRGNPIGNGTVSFFHPGTTTPKPTWKDPALTVPNPHPVTTDSNGRAQVFGTGRYRQQLRLAAGTLLFDGETSLGEKAFPLASEIAQQRFDDETAMIQTAGFAVPGKGAARYARLTTAPFAEEIDAGLGRWLFASNAGTVWWRLAEPEPTDLMYGVTADTVVTAANGVMTITGTDDSAALQAAIDHITYFPSHGRRLRLPMGLRRITRTIHIGYGETYIDWQIEGDHSRGFDPNFGYQSGIVADFDDAPALNIQAARSARLARIAVLGRNHAWLHANGELIADRAPKANWRGPQVRPVSVDSRYAPYCGIAVDGYAGLRQAASHYPDVSYPQWLGPQLQYDKAASSALTFEGVACNGFEVGIAVQPNLMPVASNGDFVRWLDCDFGLNECAVSISHSDARSISLERCRMHLCHTVLDSLSYGSGTGNFAARLDNCSFDHAYRLFNVDLGIAAQPFAATTVVTNGYCEAAYSLGTVRSATATGQPGAVRFIGGEFGFALRPNEVSPAHYLSGRGEVLARFEDVSIHGTYGLFPVDCHLADFAAAFPNIAHSVFDQSNAAGRRAASSLCGFDAPKTGRVSVRPFQIYGTDGSSHFGLRCESHGWDTTAAGAAPSGMPVPFMACSAEHLGHQAPLSAPPAEVLDRTSNPLGGLVQNGIEWSFTCAGSFLSDPTNPACCLGRGDVVNDEASGLLYYVTAVAFVGSGASLQVTMTLRQLTGVRTAGGQSWTTSHALASTTGRLRFRCARRVLPGARRRLAMLTAAGSPTVTLTAIGPETFAPDDLGPNVWTIVTGDFLMPAQRGAATLEDSVFARARVVGMGISGGMPTGQITFDTPAPRSGIAPAPLVIKAN